MTGRYWRRTIDSAQRRVIVETPDPERADLLQTVFDIQGAHHLFSPEREEHYSYVDMAARGIESGWARPLSIFERLIRKPTPIGRVSVLDENLIEVALWSKPSRRIVLDVGGDSGKATWREMEIMVRSAGFTFLLPEDH